MALDINLSAELGATGEPAAQRLALYVPNTDRHDNRIADHEKWVHEAQMLTYLRLSGLQVGLLLNFNNVALRHGMRRFVL